MIREDRVFALTTVASKAELLARFGAAAWPLCTAFRLGELVFANSSRTADGAPEFAVIQAGQQIASLPLARMSRQEVSTTLDRLFGGGGKAAEAVVLRTEPATDHYCPLCRQRLADVMVQQVCNS